MDKGLKDLEAATLKLQGKAKDLEAEGCLCLSWLFGSGRRPARRAKGPTYNSWGDSRKDKGQPSLICVAGLASSALQRRAPARCSASCCCCCCCCCCVPGIGSCCPGRLLPGSSGCLPWGERMEVSYCSITSLSLKPMSTLASLRLEAVRGRLKDGREVWTTASADRSTRPVQGTAGIRTLNPGEMIPVSVWDAFVDDLEGQFNCHAFNYDWRRWGDLVYAEELVASFRDKVVSAIREDRHSSGKASVIGHSMGAPLILYAISKLGADWQRKHIERVILVAPAHTGSPSMIPSFAHAPFVGETTPFLPSSLGEHSLGDLAATWVCMLAEMPTAVGGVRAYADGHVFAKTPSKEYRLADMGQFLKDLDAQTTGRDFGPKLWPGISQITGDMKAPAVPTVVIYSSGTPTPATYEYSTESLSAQATCVATSPGDGTITSESILAVASAWRSAGHSVELVEIPGAVDHKALIVNDLTVAVVSRQLSGGGHLMPFNVTIVRAEDLRNADTFSKSDPLCCCTLLDGAMVAKKATKKKTSTKWNDLNPVWDETFMFYCYAEGDSLLFQVFDCDAGVLHSSFDGDLLGEVTLGSEQLRRGFEGTLELGAGGKRCAAQGRLLVKVTPPKPQV